MPGQLVNDASAPSLAGALASPLITTTTGTIVEVARPARCRVRLSIGTVTSTANSATLAIEVQGSDSSTFASGVVSYGRFAALSGTDASQSSITRFLDVRPYKRYMRAIFTVAGTSPSYATLTCKLVTKDYQRTTTDSA